jgi:hypothetical protein
VDGTPVFVYKDTGKGSTAYVTQSAPHYLIRLVGTTSSPGTIDLTGWNQPVPVNTPPASEMYNGPGS